MLTVRHARFEPGPTLREDLRSRLAPAYRLVLWAIALLCVASLGAVSAASFGSVNIASFAAGLI